MHSIPYINYPYGEEVNERPHDNHKLHFRRGECKEKNDSV